MQDHPFWQFSTAVYVREGVEPLLLDLQDRVGLDINVLLACCWLAREGRSLTPAAARSAYRSTQPWSRGCIQPLRQVRQFLRPFDQHNSLRTAVKTLELEAEKVQQQALFALLSDTPVDTTGSTFEALCEHNLASYCQIVPGLEWVDVSESLLTLVSLVATK